MQNLIAFTTVNMSTTQGANDSSNSDDDISFNKEFFEQFLKYRKKKASREKRTNSLVREAQQLIEESQNDGSKISKKRKRLLGGEFGVEKTTTPNAPPKKEKLKIH